jgi:hypothetical protein
LKCPIYRTLTVRRTEDGEHGTTHSNSPTMAVSALPPRRRLVQPFGGLNILREWEIWNSGRVSAASAGGTRIIALGPHGENVYSSTRVGARADEYLYSNV